jgi:AbrB family looped-hinge helix DNA binding protein
MRITSKGQVTIPLEVRQKLGLHPHTEVAFEVVGKTARIRKARHGESRGERLVARLKGRGAGRLSTDEILALTRG